jgi:hypothetical protein
MKTTVDIPDQLLRGAKEHAARRGTTLKVVIEEALRDALGRGDRPAGAFQLRTHVVGGNGLQPGLSWGEWDTMRALAYEGRGG